MKKIEYVGIITGLLVLSVIAGVYAHGQENNENIDMDDDSWDRDSMHKQMMSNTDNHEEMHERMMSSIDDFEVREAMEERHEQMMGNTDNHEEMHGGCMQHQESTKDTGFEHMMGRWRQFFFQSYHKNRG